MAEAHHGPRVQRLPRVLEHDEFDAGDAGQGLAASAVAATDKPSGTLRSIRWCGAWRLVAVGITALSARGLAAMPGRRFGGSA